MLQRSSRLANQQFNDTAWRASLAVEGSTARLYMVDDLLRRRLLERRTHSEVIAMLGQPPPTAHFQEYDLVNRLRTKRGIFSIGSEWLSVKIGTDQRVSEARLVRD